MWLLTFFFFLRWIRALLTFTRFISRSSSIVNVCACYINQLHSPLQSGIMHANNLHITRHQRVPQWYHVFCKNHGMLMTWGMNFMRLGMWQLAYVTSPFNCPSRVLGQSPNALMRRRLFQFSKHAYFCHTLYYTSLFSVKPNGSNALITFCTIFPFIFFLFTLTSRGGRPQQLLHFHARRIAQNLIITKK